MVKGYLALVLHAHLPYVRHPEREQTLEQNWFFEAMTETYIPLLNALNRLLDDGVDYRLTISFSPPLISMMADDLLQHRYLGHLNKLVELANKEVDRTAGTEFARVAAMYLDRLNEIHDVFLNRYKMNILNGFNNLRESGKLELITSCATHGYLPLMTKKESIKAQVSVAVNTFKRHFGVAPRGIWLPECGYAPGVDEILKSYGIQFFFVDTHGIHYATPTPVNGVYAPVYTPNGVAAFGRDHETSRQVWDMNMGYPGDYNYREFYRDIGFDLDIDYIGPYIGEGGIRIDTGLKYYRITGKTDQKQAYVPEIAADRAADHAGNFLYNREKQVKHLSGQMDRPPIIVAPYDAELFGHWWYEGPQWIEFLLRKMHYDQDTVKSTTPWEYLNQYPTNQVASLPQTSWGHKGYNQVWLDPSNDWIYRHLHRAEIRMVEIARLNPEAQGLRRRAINQMARELLLAQSSDWAFIMKMDTAVDYAETRTKEHISRFNRLYWAVKNDDLDDDEIQNLELIDDIFPEIDYLVYTNDYGRVVPFAKPASALMKNNRRILMLSWEFPPKTVGGLARHVYDLTKALASLGEEVHLVTCHVPGAKAYEVVNGVHIYRVTPVHTDSHDFLAWVDRLNAAMIDCGDNLLKSNQFDLIHAHDWLVAKAGKALKDMYRLPLVTTIHATEFGRNGGIHNDIQRHINGIEWALTNESTKVICCSRYMAREIAQVFQQAAEKIWIIANGVEVKNLVPKVVDPQARDKYAAPHEKIVYFIGRLVPEKGVQVLIDAAPAILARQPNTKFVISGRGPHEEILMQKAEALGVTQKVYFTGFANDELRNTIFSGADVAVFPSLYEPFGIVALEAMAARVPVIVGDTGGLAEVIDHENDGLKVIPDNVESLANAVIRLLEDRDFANRLTHAAWNKVNSVYNWTVIAADTMRVYREVSEGTRGSHFASGQ